MSELAIGTSLTVVFRLDYKNSVKYSQKQMDEIRREITDKYPEYQKMQQISVRMDVNPDGECTTSQRVFFHRFNQKETGNILSVEPSAFFFEYHKYDKIESIIENVNWAIKILNLSNDFIISRFGLRIINQISIESGDPFDWREIITPELISSIDLSKEFGQPSRIMGIIDTNLPDHRLKLQYGLFNSEFPNNIVKKEYVLDFDCTSKEEMRIEDAVNNIEGAYRIIKDSFTKCVKSKGATILEGI
jgi:uncharacterized protein (TIGR04255 family)